MPIVTTGSNTTGQNGLIAIDKVGNKIRFYDPETIELMVALDGPEPCVHELAVSPDHALAYVPLYGAGVYGNNQHPNNKIVVVDLAARKIVDMIELGAFVAPHGMVATSEHTLWVVCDIPGKLLAVNTADRRVDAAYDCPAKGPHILCANASGSHLFISAKEGEVAVFDTRERCFVGSIGIGRPGVTIGNGSGSEGIAPTPDDRHIIAIDNDRGDLHVIEINTRRESQRVAMSRQPLTNPKRSRLGKLMFSPQGRHLVVTGYTGGNAWVIDPTDLARQIHVPVAKGPMGMAFPADGASVIVSSHDSGLLTRVELATGRPTAAYDGGSGIEVLAFF